jgi:hypothetical protein
VLLDVEFIKETNEDISADDLDTLNVLEGILHEYGVVSSFFSN